MWAQMTRIVLEELLGSVPKGGNRLDILWKTQHKAVLLLGFHHEFERVVIKVAIEVDIWFYPPVVIIVHHKRLSKEEA